MEPMTTFYLVAEDGTSTQIATSGTLPDTLRVGAETRMRNMGQRGYIISVTGKLQDGSYKEIGAVNAPEVGLDETMTRVKARKSGRKSANALFGRSA